MTQQKKQKLKRLLIMMPVFLAPVAFLGYLFFGVGKSEDQTTKLSTKESAFNAKLPNANIKETGKNKLEIYMQAQRDSAKKQDELRNDPYEKRWFDPAPPLEIQEERLKRSKNMALERSIDPNEEKVKEKLDELMHELKQPQPTPVTTQQNMPTQSKLDVAYLEQIMASMNNPGIQDPELNRIESVLERVLDIQHPDRVQQRMSEKKDSQSTTVLMMTTEPQQENAGGNTFYGLQEDNSISTTQQNSTILAQIPENQTVQNGSTLTLRLLQDVFVGDQFIPKGNRISGRCEIVAERINVQLKEIIYNNIIYPISLIVYDIDGIQGINVPGAIIRDEAKNSLGGTIQSMDIYSGNTSIASQTAQAGIQAAKGLFSKKSRKVIATIKAGHRVLLQRTSSN